MTVSALAYLSLFTQYPLRKSGFLAATPPQSFWIRWNCRRNWYPNGAADAGPGPCWTSSSLQRNSEKASRAI